MQDAYLTQKPHIRARKNIVRDKSVDFSLDYFDTENGTQGIARTEEKSYYKINKVKVVN